MAQVQVGRGVLAGMGAALAACLLALTFLLGRECGRRGTASVPLSPSAAAPATGAGPSATRVVPAAADPGGAPQDPPVPPAGPADPLDPQRSAAQAYFAALDRIAPGQLAGDPQALAQEMVGGLSKGDATGFDRLLTQAEEARLKVLQLSPPPALAAHHQESLALLDENLALLKGIRRALEGGEREGSLGAQLARAQALQARSEALEQADKALRARYGAGSR